jgi:hypothetical protein
VVAVAVVCASVRVCVVVRSSGPGCGCVCECAGECVFDTRRRLGLRMVGVARECMVGGLTLEK